MDLVDVEGRVVHRVFGLLVPELLVTPAEAGKIIQLAGGGGPGLRVESIGVRLEMHGAVRAFHRIFVGRIFLQVRDKALPDLSVFPQPGGAALPVIEIPHHRDRLGVGGPHPKFPTGLPALFRRMRTEPLPSVCQCPRVKTGRLFLFSHVSAAPFPRSAPIGAHSGGLEIPPGFFGILLMDV